MQGFVTTVQLPDGLNKAIAKAVSDSFNDAQEKLNKCNQYPPYMTLTETAKYLGLSYNTLKKLVRVNPNFPVTPIGNTYRVNRQALDNFMLNK